jgi:hypothetical protein
LAGYFYHNDVGRNISCKNQREKGKRRFLKMLLQGFRCKWGNRNFATWFWDYDNDGWLDLFVGNYTFEGSLAFYAAAEHLHKMLEIPAAFCTGITAMAHSVI